jgi:hypothetical protein
MRQKSGCGDSNTDTMLQQTIKAIKKNTHTQHYLYDQTVDHVFCKDIRCTPSATAPYSWGRPTTTTTTEVPATTPSSKLTPVAAFPHLAIFRRKQGAENVA